MPEQMSCNVHEGIHVYGDVCQSVHPCVSIMRVRSRMQQGGRAADLSVSRWKTVNQSVGKHAAEGAHHALNRTVHQLGYSRYASRLMQATCKHQRRINQPEWAVGESGCLIMCCGSHAMQRVRLCGGLHAHLLLLLADEEMAVCALSTAAAAR